MQHLLAVPRSLLRRAYWALRRSVRPTSTPAQSPEAAARFHIATQYLTGQGLEIGALHQPLKVPPGVRVRYVDRLPTRQLRDHYPELKEYRFAPVHILDDGETLSTVADASCDFLIANHVLEHCEDPIGTLGNWMRVLKPGGVLYLALPHRAFTFDRDRPLTTLEHLIQDHQRGPEGSRSGHYLEWARLVDRVAPDMVDTHARALEMRKYSIHFHVWSEDNLRPFLEHCRSTEKIPFSVELMQQNVSEIISVLRKRR